MAAGAEAEPIVEGSGKALGGCVEEELGGLYEAKDGLSMRRLRRQGKSLAGGAEIGEIDGAWHGLSGFVGPCAKGLFDEGGPRMLGEVFVDASKGGVDSVLGHTDIRQSLTPKR
jgi:hypothetical protein